MKILGVEFAPISIPLERRIQTLAVFYVLSEYLFGIYSYLFIIFLLFTKYYYIPLLYLSWLYYDRHSCRRGGRLIPWIRNVGVYKLYAKYFPIKLEKTAELDPSKNYIFGYHPHGILASGAFANFATNGTGFSELFPGITSRLVTLEMNFWFPIHRDLSLFRGHISAERESLEFVLTKCGTGNAVVLVVGGAAEAIDAIPNTMRLTIKSRKGFIRVALRTGASLVPVISFGENEIYVMSATNTNSLTRQFQIQIKRLFRFTLPLFHGRGVFQYSMGLLPYRHPINTIVGPPIHVEKIKDPSQEEVDKVHAKYLKALIKLFNENKGKYAKDPKLELEFQ